MEKIKIGISSCLLGNRVRYNGGHCRDRYLTETLGFFVDYVPVCPEVECGMPVPRESMRLQGKPDSTRLLTSKTGEDKTDQMEKWIPEKLKALEKESLCGFIFKSKSPSSGLHKVKLYSPEGIPGGTATGLFAKAFTEYFPDIPVEEEGRLHDIKLRENFIEQIFTLRRWRDQLSEARTPGGLVNFHSRNKLLILSHHQATYREMGKLVAKGGRLPVDTLFSDYEKLLLKALSYKTTSKKHINVLLHMMGYFKKSITPDEKAELLESIDQYRAEYVPLIVPLTLLKHYARKYKTDYLLSQTYIDPHPIELKLRAFI